MHWNAERLLGPLAHTRHVQGVLLGHMRALGFRERDEASLHTLIADVLQTSEIEGERLDVAQVRSSLATRLGLDVGGLPLASRWLLWFVACLQRAVAASERELERTLARARFWAKHAALPLHERQRKVLALLLDGRIDTLSSSKWAKLTKCSQDTAGRDIAALVQWGILAAGPGRGRASHYVLVDPA
jgi:Fic family protein